MAEITNLKSKEITQKKQKILDHSDPRYARIVPDSGSTTVDLSVNSTSTDTVFQIPAYHVFNFARSHFRYKEDQGAGNLAGADNFIYRFADLIPHIYRIQVRTQNQGQILCDIVDCHKYTNAVLRYQTMLTDMLQNDCPLGNASTGNVGTGGGIFEGLCPNTNIRLSAIASAAPGNTQANINTAIDTVVSSLACHSTSNRPLNTEQRNIFMEPLYYLKNTEPNSTFPIYNRIPLSVIGKNTILDMDRNFYFGDVVEIIITWNSTNKIMWRARATPVANTAVALAMTLSSLELMLCVENNTVIVQEMKDHFAKEGFNVKIPFVHHTQAKKTGDVQHIDFELTSSKGSHLQKIIWTPYNPDETYGNTYYHGLGPHYGNALAPVANTHIVQFSPILNSIPIYTQNPIRQYNGAVQVNEPYLYQRHRLKGTCITSVDDYNYNFSWYEDFTAPYAFREYKNLDLLDPDVYIDGIPLIESQKYEIDIQFGNGVNPSRTHHMWAICLRDLSIRPGEILIK